MKLLTTTTFQCFLIIISVLVVYGHTLDVPFYLDDHLSIRINHTVHSLDWAKLWRSEPMRFLPYASLALNYQFHQLQPAGYHAVNIVGHCLASLSVWWLARTLSMTPAVKGRLSGKDLILWPLLAALLFALHPLQTQAVTYIVQRAALFAALFYLLAMTFYLKLRLASGGISRMVWAASLILASVAAILSKQNAATLPLTLLLLELAFFPARHPRPVLLSLIFMLVAAALVTLAAMNWVDLPWLDQLDRLTRETTWFSRSEYLAAQVKVVGWYLRLFFRPLGLRLDYSLHQAAGWSDWLVITAALGHLVLIGGALVYLRRYPVPALGVLFYYVAHVVESSVLPIRDLVFEHRTYLPNSGLVLALGWILAVEIPRRFSVRRVWLQGTTVVILIVLALLTWQRNQLWRDPVRFWQDNVAREPDSLRPKMELANAYFDIGKNREALALSREIVDSTPWPIPEHLPETDIVNLAIAYYMNGYYERALQLADEWLTKPLRGESRSNLWMTKGDVYYARKQYPVAEQYYRKAVEIYPDNLNAMLYLGESLGVQGKFREAAIIYRTILKKSPGHRKAKEKLALAEYLLRKKLRARTAPR